MVFGGGIVEVFVLDGVGATLPGLPCIWPVQRVALLIIGAPGRVVATLSAYEAVSLAVGKGEHYRLLIMYFCACNARVTVYLKLNSLPQ